MAPPRAPRVDAPDGFLDELAAAGADAVSFHLEAVGDPAPTQRKVRGLGMRAGIALAPRTAAEAAFAFLDDADDVVVLAVEPGWAGQPFQLGAEAKIEALRSEIDRRGLDAEVHVDGGVNLETVARCVQAGADVLVAATAIFGAGDPVRSALELKATAEAKV